MWVTLAQSWAWSSVISMMMELIQGNWFIMLCDAKCFMPVMFHMGRNVLLYAPYGTASLVVGGGMHGL